MSNEEVWSEDVCTCGHLNSSHVNGKGECATCADEASWNAGVTKRVCPRYQWNGKPRVRTW